jgi:hypothetical protein
MQISIPSGISRLSDFIIIDVAILRVSMRAPVFFYWLKPPVLFFRNQPQSVNRQRIVHMLEIKFLNSINAFINVECDIAEQI